MTRLLLAVALAGTGPAAAADRGRIAAIDLRTE